ncbi:hypothetical protein CPB86DRAFT_474533 [Serendipita vermifera]|nr:hypothetical protein CPB86DRAFT_474533 [Serendipita vermifera]
MNPNTQTTDVAIYREPTLAVARLNFDGIGGTCNQALSRAANTLGDKVGRVAHRMGKGPEAAMDRILKSLKTKDRKALLEEWYQLPRGNDIFPGLEGYLHTLLKYALPKETIETQITAFVAIASLIPQYPPLRSICLRYKKFKELTDPKEAALSLWKREHAPSDPRWDGFYQIAVACLSDDISRILEKTPVERWGRVSVSQLGVIDQLLAKISSERLEALDYVAIRYLGGILQLPTFWEHGNYKRHQATAKVLLQKLLHCIKETGIEHKGKEELFSDREGIDLLVHATLHGIQRWLESIPERKARRQQCWFNNLQKLLEPLSRPEAKVLLPLSWQRTKEKFQIYCKERWIIGLRRVSHKIDPWNLGLINAISIVELNPRPITSVRGIRKGPLVKEIAQ